MALKQISNLLRPLHFLSLNKKEMEIYQAIQYLHPCRSYLFYPVYLGFLQRTLMKKYRYYTERQLKYNLSKLVKKGYLARRTEWRKSPEGKLQRISQYRFIFNL